MTRVLVCGGRDCEDEEFVFTSLDSIHAENPITFIIEGGQRTWRDGQYVGGVDLFACRWSYRNGIPGARYDANWKKFGKSAGPRRNTKMIGESHPDVVVAFPGGAGTDDCVRKARAAGIEVREIPGRVGEGENV